MVVDLTTSVSSQCQVISLSYSNPSFSNRLVPINWVRLPTPLLWIPYSDGEETCWCQLSMQSKLHRWKQHNIWSSMFACRTIWVWRLEWNKGMWQKLLSENGAPLWASCSSRTNASRMQRSEYYQAWKHFLQPMQRWFFILWIIMMIKGTFPHNHQGSLGFNSGNTNWHIAYSIRMYFLIHP